MGQLGVHFAITDDEEKKLLSAKSDEEREEITEGLEIRWDKENLVETDKSWNAIHRCLSDGNLFYEGGPYPLHWTILGGKQLYDGEDYTISYKTAAEVQDIANALPGISEEWFTEKIESLKRTDYPKAYLTGQALQDTMEYTWTYLNAVRAFYTKAALEKKSVIFTVGA